MKCPECLLPLKESGRTKVMPINESGDGVVLVTPFECVSCDVKVAFSQAYNASPDRPHTYMVDG